MGVVAGEPVGEVEEFLEGGDRVLGGNGFVAVDGEVSEFTDVVAFAVENFAEESF